jgi:hypothetical protein
MAELWWISSDDMNAPNSAQSPDPVTEGMPTWTWDVPLNTSPNQWTVAKSSVTSFSSIGAQSAWVFSGVVAYRTRDANGNVTDHPQNGSDGVTDFISDWGVADVTFGYGIGCSGYWVTARVNLEVWVTG